MSEARSTQLETLTITQLTRTVHVYDWMINESLFTWHASGWPKNMETYRIEKIFERDLEGQMWEKNVLLWSQNI